MKARSIHVLLVLVLTLMPVTAQPAAPPRATARGASLASNISTSAHLLLALALSQRARSRTIAAPVGSSAARRGAVSSYATTVLADHPLIYDRLNEKRGPTAFDSSGKGHNGRYQSGVTFGVAGAMLTSAHAAIASTGLAVMQSGTTLPSGRAPRTLELWLRAPAADQQAGTLLGYGGSNVFILRMSTFYGRTYLDILGNGGSVAAAGLQPSPVNFAADQKWHLVDITYDGRIVTFYIDGAGLSRQALALNTDVPGQGSSGLRIGGFGGDYSDVAVYATALSPGQIARHWTRGASHAVALCAAVPTSAYAQGVLADRPSVYYRLDDLITDPAGRVAFDASGHCHNATLADGVTSQPVGAMLTSAHAAIASTGLAVMQSGTTLPSGRAPRTLELWLRAPAADQQAGTLLGYGGSNVFILRMSTFYGRTYLDILGNGGSVAAAGLQPSPVNFAADQKWHLVDITYDGRIVTFYIDGAGLSRQALALNTDVPGQGSSGLRIGGFGGDYSDVAVYATALSPDRIQAHLLLSMPPTQSTCTGLQAKGVIIEAYAREVWAGTVATFCDADPHADASLYTASVTVGAADQLGPPRGRRQEFDARPKIIELGGEDLLGPPKGKPRPTASPPSSTAVGPKEFAVVAVGTFLSPGTYDVLTVIHKAAGGSPSGGGVVSADSTAKVDSGSPGAPASVSATASNGGVRVTWQPPISHGRGPITGYVVTAAPIFTDRVPRPSASAVSAPPVGPNTRTWTFGSGLVEDCHQRYVITVAAKNADGTGPDTTSATFRPSGIVKHGTPPYVVILLDGISESKPGFTMDPYAPTTTGPASYCPENINAAGSPVDNAFTQAPNGPAEFFNKWNYFDPADRANDNVPDKMSNSTPRDLTTGAKTHRFMLDAIAGTGAVILPFSYNGALLSQASRTADPFFVFPAYTACNSNPGPVAGFGCDADPGGAPDPRGIIANQNWPIDYDAHKLAAEAHSIQAVWGNVPIVVVGHSQGGLIAFKAWQSGLLPTGTRLFSLDAPINGVCPFRFRPTGHCIEPSGYPDYDSRVSTDAGPKGYLTQDKAAGYAFRFIGTWGDSVLVTITAPLTRLSTTGPAYGTGDETLQHELLVSGSNCVDASNRSDCPDWPNGPDHISSGPQGECRIPGNGWVKDDQHFIVKFCPGNVDYFNHTLGLSY